uniref:Uncharacterized protein n=1 Tax=Anguilla anguilla TaxID=7936 RepID=A0A0E9T0N5_ANGAN
MVTVNPYYIL